MSLRFRPGDRVRIIHPNHEYTGCRGTIADAAHADADGVTVLGHHVAIDGENGLLRPFLASELEPLRAVQSGGRARSVPAPRTSERGHGPQDT
jgi:hypothetical protein